MKNYNIMWIDDNINDPELIPDRESLEEMGCHITPVENADAALIYTNTIQQFDCIIIDLCMPLGKKLNTKETRFGTRTGLILTKRIKEKHPESKIIIYSVFNAQDVSEYCRNNSGIYYLCKMDYLSDEFAEKVVNIIKGEL